MLITYCFILYIPSKRIPLKYAFKISYPLLSTGQMDRLYNVMDSCR